VRVRLSPAALNDLEQIAGWIAEKGSPNRALSFAEELQLAAASLGDLPERYALDRELGKFGVRRMPYGSYLVLYSVEAGEVMVLRFVDAARDYAKLFPDDQDPT